MPPRRPYQRSTKRRKGDAPPSADRDVVPLRSTASANALMQHARRAVAFKPLPQPQQQQQQQREVEAAPLVAPVVTVASPPHPLLDTPEGKVRIYLNTRPRLDTFELRNLLHMNHLSRARIYAEYRVHAPRKMDYISHMLPRAVFCSLAAGGWGWAPGPLLSEEADVGACFGDAAQMDTCSGAAEPWMPALTQRLLFEERQYAVDALQLGAVTLFDTDADSFTRDRVREIGRCLLMPPSQSTDDRVFCSSMCSLAAAGVEWNPDVILIAWDRHLATRDPDRPAFESRFATVSGLIRLYCSHRRRYCDRPMPMSFPTGLCFDRAQAKFYVRMLVNIARKRFHSNTVWGALLRRTAAVYTGAHPTFTVTMLGLMAGPDDTHVWDMNNPIFSHASELNLFLRICLPRYDYSYLVCSATRAMCLFGGVSIDHALASVLFDSPTAYVPGRSALYLARCKHLESLFRSYPHPPRLL